MAARYFDVVVGNPPFLGQLRRRTAHDAARQAQLQERHGALVRPYTDPAWLFLAAAVDAVAPGGRVALVQPQSLLAARDAEPVRAHLDAVADLDDVWVDAGGAFAASVDVCAPVLRRRDGGMPRPADWTAALARAHGIPTIEPVGAGTNGHG